MIFIQDGTPFFCFCHLFPDNTDPVSVVPYTLGMFPKVDTFTANVDKMANADQWKKKPTSILDFLKEIKLCCFSFSSPLTVRLIIY